MQDSPMHGVVLIEVPWWKALPSTAHCVYRLYNEAHHLLYVGVTSSPRRRLRTHGRTGRFAWVRLEWFDSRHEAEASEAAAIASEHPLLNVAPGTGRFQVGCPR